MRVVKLYFFFNDKIAKEMEGVRTCHMLRSPYLFKIMIIIYLFA